MASLLKAALESNLGGVIGQVDASAGMNNQSGQPEATAGKVEAAGGSPEQDLVVLKGPLAEQFSLALAKLYTKNAEVKQEDDQAQVATETVAVESQANDELALRQLASDVRVLTQDETADSATTIYGVDGNEVKPEDVVQVSQDLGDWDAQVPDFVVVMDADLPSVNGEGGGGDVVPELNEYGRAMEALCDRASVPVFFSLEAYAEAKLRVRAEPKEKQKEELLKFAKGQKTPKQKEATDEGQGIEYCDPEVLGVVMKITQEKYDVNLGEDHEFFPEGKVDALKAQKVKDYVKAIELHFGKKIDHDAGMQMTTPKSIARYFSKGSINGKPVKTV